MLDLKKSLISPNLFNSNKLHTSQNYLNLHKILFIIFIISIFCWILLLQTICLQDQIIVETDNNSSFKTLLVEQQKENVQTRQKNGRRIILWTKYYGSFDYSAAGLHSSTFESCEYKCEIVVRDNNNMTLQAIDIVIMAAVPDKLPPNRHPNQSWILLLPESPPHTGNLSTIKQIFNWTMSYRSDSDVYHPYGLIKPINSYNTAKDLSWNWNLSSSYSNLLQLTLNKTKLAVITVSHCQTPSNRESYIRELSDHIPIDVYGKCGNYSCPSAAEMEEPLSCKRKSSSLRCNYEKFYSCYTALAKSYKFYLSFENSLCSDYVTEKFYYALTTNMIPIVYGGNGNGNYFSSIAPPHSFINSADYSSSAELGKYLLYLDSHPEKYLKYFEWKEHYSVDTSMTSGWCSLCSRLSSSSDNVNYKSYDDVQTWWRTKPTNNTIKNNNSNHNLTPACKDRPKFIYNGWANPKINLLY